MVRPIEEPMSKPENVALADAILAGDVQFDFTPPPETKPEGDTPKAGSSEAPTPEPVTPADGGKQEDGAGSDAANTTPEATVAFPAWLPEEAKGAFAGLPEEARGVLAKAMDERKRSIEADATDKWMKAAEAEKDAKKWRSLVSDPVKGPKVLAALEAQSEPQTDPVLTRLNDLLGEDAAKAIIEAVEARGAATAKAVVHERIDAPQELRAQVNDAAFAYRERLGTKVSDAEFAQAVKTVGVSLGYTDDNPHAPYRVLTPENVAHHLSVALTAIKAAPKAALPTSPPKPPAPKPASIPSNGMALDTKSEPAWKRENRAPKPGEQASHTIRRHGLTEADIERAMRAM